MARERSLELLKLEAKRLRRAKGIKHAEALEEISRAWGFVNYHMARTVLRHKERHGNAN